jgi:hypothetical protein
MFVITYKIAPGQKKTISEENYQDRVKACEKKERERGKTI